jgi:phospholipid/cholesterol/gamma-HCH transport system ATP-binding protein
MQRAPRQEINRLRRRIGMAFQGGALFGSMTLFENIELPLREFTRLSPSTRDIVVRIKLTLVGLDGSGDLYPSELSGGMKKRASLARAMALDPELLFFDEPSSGLDPITAAGLDRLLLQLKAVFGVTMLVVTHELESAFTIADRIALIHEGRFAAIGTPDEIRSSDDPVVRRFVQRRPSEDIAAATRRVG